MKTLAYVAALGLSAAVPSAPAQSETYNGSCIGIQAGRERGEMGDSINSQLVVAEASLNMFVPAITDRVSARDE